MLEKNNKKINKGYKSFFNLSTKDQEKIVREAIIASNREQLEMMKSK